MDMYEELLVMADEGKAQTRHAETLQGYVTDVAAREGSTVPRVRGGAEITVSLAWLVWMFDYLNSDA